MAGAVLTERRGQVLVITLNRPDARNAVNAELAQGVAPALDELDGERELSVGVLTGAGKGFCAGMDLKAFVQGESPHVEGRGFAGIAQQPPRKPLIAAIEGFAVAGGLEVALACDLIVAAKGAKLGYRRSSAAWWPRAGRCCGCRAGSPTTPPWSWRSPASRSPPSAGPSWAWSTASPSPAARWTGPWSWRDAIARNAPLALEASKRILVEAPGWAEDEAWQRQGEISGPVFVSEDAREGATAFAEKRDPVWKGRRYGDGTPCADSS